MTGRERASGMEGGMDEGKGSAHTLSPAHESCKNRK
jgi:hypothetical protein